MPRRATGEVKTYERADGGITFYARFRAYGQRRRVKLGTDLEGWNEQRAENEVAKIVAQVARGVWRPAAGRSDRVEDPTFHEFSTSWYRRKRRGIDQRTQEDYEWRLSNHLLPYFQHHRISEIDVPAVDAYREAKLEERDANRAAGGRALSNDSINATIALLATILDEAIEHKLPVDTPNPARSRKRYLKSQRRRRSFLEPDQAAALIDAARHADAAADGPLNWPDVCMVRRSRESNVELARRLGVSDSLVSRVRRRAIWRVPKPPPARHAVVSTLVLAGPRIAEACALDVGDFDRANRTLNVADAKTDEGVRRIQLSDLAYAALDSYLSARASAAPDEPLFVNQRGARYTPSGIRSSVLVPVVAAATREMVGSGGRMPSVVTPHTLRRTYISLLLAGGADVPWVMAQVGHADPKVTLQIYAQVLQSKLRDDYGARVDAMVSGAGSSGTRNGTKSDSRSGSTKRAMTSRIDESSDASGD